ncbi:EamA/RhaT family transporter [Ramlibacter sp.]|uniref:EamA family transporter n=1 Tax=Ramlibacter sp. TaxID=1917967 RepID=UPI003D0C379D
MSVANPWLWFAVVLFAAFTQTIRNMAQRSLSGQAGMLGATLARFLYGIPFAFAGMLLVQNLWGEPWRLPPFTVAYIAWLFLGAATQAIATAMLLAAMKHGNFVVSVTYSKTEVLQVAFFGAVFLHELPSVLSLAGMVVALAGVILLMRAKMSPAAAAGQTRTWGGFSPSAWFGLGAGACFAIAAIGYRAAALELMAVSGAPAWHVSTWSVLLAQIMQSAGVMAWLLVRNRAAIVAVFSGWRVSLTAGCAGALASLGWFLAYALQTPANVRAVGMVEVVFSYVVSRRLLSEGVTQMEKAGLLLVVAGAVGTCIGAA